MTRETKVGLLVGMGVILLIGIIISDHLSVVQQQNPAIDELTGFALRAQESIAPADPPPAGDRASAPRFASSDAAPRGLGSAADAGLRTVPTPAELSEPPAQADRMGADAPTPRHDLPQAYRLDQSAVAADSTGATADTANSANNDRFASVPRITLSHLPGRDRGVPSPQDDSATGPWTGPIPAPLPLSAVSAADAAGQGAPIIHYVQPGETLYQIARKYYGNGDYWRTIAAHNADRVGSNGQVNQNVRLVVPNRAGLAALGDDFIPVGRELTHRLAPAVRPDPPKTITVAAGDTLSELASTHLGSATRWRELFEANRDQLDRPENLRVGMKLKLPGEKPAQAQAEASSIPSVQPSPLRVLTPRVRPVARSSSPATATGASNAPSGQTYVVEPGDSLYRIAAETLGDGERWREVYEANRDVLSDPDAVVVGQKLFIPSRSAAR